MKKALTYATLLFALLLSAGCSRERFTEDSGTDPYLSVRPHLLRSEEAATKVEDTDPGIVKDDEVAARDELRENFFGTLDVFVKLKAAPASDNWFKEYHLRAGDAGVIVDPDKYDSESLLNQAKQALCSNWAEQGYEPGVPYDIYVTANNPHTAEGSAPESLSELQALTTNTPDVFRYYLNYTPPSTDPVYYSNCMYSEKKEFLMDGSIDGWMIDPNKAEQVFDVDLQRAAAKVIVTVKFSDEKTIPMIPEPTASDPDPEPIKDAYGNIVYGSVKEYLNLVGRTAGVPRWKPVNFCLTGSDIAYDTDPLPASQALTTLDGNFTPFQEGTSTDNTENTFALVSYTYPVDWTSDKSRIPYVLLSVFYTNDSGDQLRSYYRVPVCDEKAVSSLDRNHVYVVDVEIASLGASNDSFEAKDEELRIEYHVIPWTETNMSQEATTVKISDTKYLTIIPTEYILKGDNTESVDLQWYASVSIDDGRIVDIDSSTLEVTYVNYLGNTTDIKGTVTKQVRNDSGTLVTATDANTDGRRDIVITSTAPSTGAKNEKLTITLTPNGILRVESEALLSRAIKDISFTVYLKNATGVDAVPIKIRHFPLDNIQSITGLWSSKWNESYETRTVTEYTTSLSEAQGWGTYTTQTNPSVSYETYLAYSGPKTDNSEQTTLTNAQIAAIFDVTNNNQRNANAYATGANSLETAIEYNGRYYWVTRSGNYNNYTYRYYVADTFTLSGTVYSHTKTERVASTGSWVDWEYHTGNVNYDNRGFYAKVYVEDFAHRIETDASSYTAQNFSNLTNRQMYVIQLTSTSDSYAIGKPVLDSNYQSNDDVCSPAFMIASQLGATMNNQYTGETAAEHCGTYMEVGTDGTRYTGWRLPTKSEIETIIKYQTETAASYGVTMVRVLAGREYWALDGNLHQAYASGTNGSFVRCVRDLTYAEINALNKTSD